jgi:hypothetical protein
MSLEIATSSLPQFFEGIAIPNTQFGATGQTPGSTLTWSLEPRNPQGVLISLPPGLAFSSGGLLTGTPTDISDPGPGTISGTAETQVLTITSGTAPVIYPGTQLLVGSNYYTVSSFTAGSGTHTVRISGNVVAGGHTAAAYSIVPIGGAKSFPIIVKLEEVLASELINSITRPYTITILRLNNPETLFQYLTDATDFDGKLSEQTYTTAYNTLGSEERALIISLRDSTVTQYDQVTGAFQKYVVLPAFSTNDNAQFDVQ